MPLTDDQILAEFQRAIAHMTFSTTEEIAAREVLHSYFAAGARFAKQQLEKEVLPWEDLPQTQTE